MNRIPVILGLLICGILLSACRARQSSPEETIRYMTSAIRSEDTGRILKLIDPVRLEDPALRIVVIGAIEQRVQASIAHGGIARVEVLELKVFENTSYATVLLHYKDGSQGNGSESYKLVRRGIKWYVGV